MINELKSIGLNSYQARAFHFLLNTGECTASLIASKTRIPKPRVYDVLESLHSLGLITIIPGRPVKFASLQPEQAFDNFKKLKELSLKKELNNLHNVKNLISKNSRQIELQSSVNLISNRTNIYNFLLKQLNKANNEVIISSSNEGIKRKYSFLKNKLNDLNKSGLKINFLGFNPDNEFAVKKRKTNLRFVLVDDSLLFFLGSELVPENEKAIFIKDPSFVNEFKKLI